jgi:osmoprotectant transport system substrate-binding protein
MLTWFRQRKALSWLLGLLLLYAGARLVFFYEERQTDLSIGSKNFTESILLGELYAQALERKGFQVKRKFNLGGTLIAHEAIKRGEVDLYPEYTGTGLLDVLHISPPQTETEAFKVLEDAYQQRWKLRWLEPAQANNSQGLVMLRRQANRFHISNLSELSRRASGLRLGSIPEFDEREDGLPGLKKSYGGFRFKKIALYDNGLKYQILERGDVDVTVAFTTDGALIHPRFLLLKDDRNFWPAYRVAPVIRDEKLKAHPEVVRILNQISAGLTTETLQKLNYRVEQQKQDYKKVIQDYLVKHP